VLESAGYLAFAQSLAILTWNAFCGGVKLPGRMEVDVLSMKPPHSEDESFDENETARRRDAALLRALSTPHKKQADMKMGRSKPKANDASSRKKRRRLTEKEV